MPDTTLLDIPEEEKDQMLAALRRARYGYLLALHVLLLCAAGRNPTDIAAFLFCSRSSVYRIVRLYRARKLGFTVDAEGQLKAPVQTTILMPWMKRSLGHSSRLHPVPMAGVGRGGVVPRWLPNSRRNTAWRFPHRPYHAGSMKWLGVETGQAGGQR